MATGYVLDYEVENMENTENLAYFCTLVCDEISNDECRRAYKRMFTALRRSGYSVDDACEEIRLECLQDDLFYELLPRISGKTGQYDGTHITEYSGVFHGVSFAVKFQKRG